MTTEYRYLIKNGEALWVMTSANPIFKNNEVVGVQGMLVDITERKEMEKQYLEKLGYTVTARTSSIEALAAFRFYPQRFDLVITDMTMSNMTGDSLASEIKSIRPDIPVILCTGFSEHIENNGDELDADAFLMKPVARKKMARTVRSVLDKIRWQD